MVRLLEASFNAGSLSIMFQFLLVRLLDKGDVWKLKRPKFQFLLVRLLEVSKKLRTWGGLFQFLLVRLLAYILTRF